MSTNILTENCNIMQPKISVIVPVYKAEKYLHRCVDSILAQTFTDFELLLINDGSPDNSGAICNEYATKDSRVRVFHKENGGVSSARNLGLDNAKGEWVTFCDSDDYVTPDWLAAYEIAINKNVDIAIQGICYINESKIQPKEISPQTSYTINGKRKLIIEQTNQCILCYVVVKLFRKDIIDKYNLFFNEEIALWEDAVFVAQYLEHVNSFICANTIGYHYYLPPVNKTYKSNVYRSVYLILKSFNTIFEEDIPDEIITHYFNIFKDYMITSIVENDIVEPECFDLYCNIVKKKDKNNLLNFLINSSRNSFLASFCLKIIHRLLTLKNM